MEYPAPLMLALFTIVLARRPLRLIDLSVATALVAVPLLLVPDVRNLGEQLAVHATWSISHALVGGSAGQALALFALVCGLMLVAVLGLKMLGRHGPVVLAVLAGLILLGQSREAWHWHFVFERAVRSNVPSDREWVDHHADGNVARLLTIANDFNTAYTDFFNDKVTQVYRLGEIHGTQPQGRVCSWRPGENGVVSFGAGCGTPPRRLLLDDTLARPTFYGQHVLRDAPNVGRLVAVPAKPRVMALLTVPCGYGSRRVFAQGLGHEVKGVARPCQAAFTADLFLDRPQSLVLRFKGGRQDHVVAAGGQTFGIPAGGEKELTFNAPAGHSTVVLQLDWNGYEGTPVLQSAQLRGQGRTTELL